MSDHGVLVDGRVRGSFHQLGPGRYDPGWSLTLREVNGAFAAAAAEQAAPGATVWVYGHTLPLVPAMLRRGRPDLRIGCYVPTHFPSADSLPAMPVHREVLLGLLAADVVGFQTSVAAENFLRAARELTERVPNVGVFPASASAADIVVLVGTPAVAAAASRMRTRLGNPEKVIHSINPPEPSQGVAQRLLALGKAFADGGFDPGAVVLPGARMVNPYDDQSVADGLAAALDGAHGVNRTARTRRWVTRNGMFAWFDSFLRTVRDAGRFPIRLAARLTSVPRPVRAVHPAPLSR